MLFLCFTELFSQIHKSGEILLFLKTHTKTHTGHKKQSERASCLLRFLECVPENLACPLHGFLIRVCVHPECNGLIAMAQLFGYAGNVRAVGDGYGGKTMEAKLWRQNYV